MGLCWFQVQKLQDQYGLAEKKLTNRAGKSYTAKERALRLFERASQLFVNTNAKEKDLKGTRRASILVFSATFFVLLLCELFLRPYLPVIYFTCNMILTISLIPSSSSRSSALSSLLTSASPSLQSNFIV